MLKGNFTSSFLFRINQRLDKASNFEGALSLKTVIFKVIFKIPGGDITMFSTKAEKFRGGTGPSGPPSYLGAELMHFKTRHF